MIDEDLKALWKRGAPTATLTRGDLEPMLRPTARRADRSLAVITWTYAVMLGVTVVLALANLPGYRQNPTMLAVEGGIAIVSAALAVATTRLMGRLRTMSRADVPLLEAVEARLAFAERNYGRWLWTASATPWLLAHAIVTLIDNQGGVYRVNHPVEFALVTAVMFAITYASLRFATATTVHELRAIAQDLRVEALEATPGLAVARRRSRRWTALGVVLLTLAVLAGLWLWLSAA
jgi:hypothetical protein